MGSLYDALIEAVKVTDAGVPTGPVAGRVFRTGQVPELDKLTAPYVTIDYPVTEAPALRGDHRTLARGADAAVSVWIPLDDEGTYLALGDAVRVLFEGARLRDYDGCVNGCDVFDAGRIPDEDEGWLQHLFLLRVNYVPPPPAE